MSVRTLRWFFVVILAASPIPRVIAQSSGQAEVLPGGQTALHVSLSLDGVPAMGDEKARVAVVEFSDYQCPFCLIHANQSLPRLVSDYVKTGKVRYFFKDFPIESVHSQALREAEAAHCAGEQGKYWEMHDRLLKNQQPQVVDELPAYALALGLDVSRFRQCLDKGVYAAQVQRGIEDGKKYRIQGTPTFFIGTLDNQGLRMDVLTMIYGAQPYADFQKALDPILANAYSSSGQ